MRETGAIRGTNRQILRETMAKEGPQVNAGRDRGIVMNNVRDRDS